MSDQDFSKRKPATVSNNVIHLDKFRIGLRHWANGVLFPQLYRLTGYHYNAEMDAQGQLRWVEGRGEPAEPQYVLSNTYNYAELIDPEVEPINVMTRGIDQGWLIVRHHRSYERALGYIDAIGDFDAAYCERVLWQTDDGVFTLLHRPAVEGRPDNLIVYITEQVRTSELNLPPWDMAFHIVYPDGATSQDDAVLFPPECE
jgi:hypothetical protein